MVDENHAISRANQSLTPGDRIELYTIDLSPLGDSQVWHFSPQGECRFNGITYIGFDVETEGFEMNGQGALPQPKIRLSNTQRTFGGVTLQYQDLIGAKVTRLRTYRQFLDDQPMADVDAYFTPDIYIVDQKTAHDKTKIEWTLSAAMDQQGRQIPGRQVLRDLCLWRYRFWNTETNSFDYTKVQCPYTGATSYDIDGNVVDSPGDDCARTITACKLRFGAKNVLPYGGFPGVARVRV